MQKITSFQIDHRKLTEGLYVSRIDRFGSTVTTTFDIRMKKPNQGDYLTTTAMHTIEHLGATFLRNDEQFKDKTVYFGPMGCRTGFYAVFFGEYTSMQIAPLITEMFRFMIDYEGDVPGASEIECGNYRDLCLEDAQKEAEKFYDVLLHLTDRNTVYQ